MAADWRPDPAKGVFETLLVLDGRPVERDAHLARLNASLAALYPSLPPPDLDVPVERGPYGHRSTGTSLEGLRIAVAPGAGGELAATIERRPATGHFAPENGGQLTTHPVGLRSFTLAGGLGAHKWADRSLLDEAQAGLPDGTLPLILDEDGTVLEASRANVFAVRGGALFTPPLDGRVLPGVTRMRVLELAGTLDIETCEESLSRNELFASEAVFLTGSVRGIEGVDSLDRVALKTRSDAADRISSELWRRWAIATAAVEV